MGFQMVKLKSEVSVGTMEFEALYLGYISNCYKALKNYHLTWCQQKRG